MWQLWKAIYKEDSDAVVNPFAEAFVQRLPKVPTSVAKIPIGMPKEEIERLAERVAPSGFKLDRIEEVKDYAQTK
ncbi:MAG: hypothetical protein D4Q79_01520 [Spirochaetia bacterium]|nr:MAG: hypothetical protein D4Q79_01520 [Spirochaetia bacterium]